MLEYRVFLLGSDGHIKAAEELTCETDQEACEYANRIETEFLVREVWRGTQKVAVISAEASERRDALSL